MIPVLCHTKILRRVPRQTKPPPATRPRCIPHFLAVTEHEAIIFQYDHRERTADFADNAEIGLRPDRAEKVEQENSRAHSAGTKEWRSPRQENSCGLLSIIYSHALNIAKWEISNLQFEMSGTSTFIREISVIRGRPFLGDVTELNRGFRG